MRILSVVDLADELKPDCLLKTLVLWLYGNELLALLVSTIVSRAEMQPINTSGYRDEQSNLDTTANTLGLQARQTDNVYKDEESNLKNPARISELSAGKSDNLNSKVRLPLKEVTSNPKTTVDLLPKKRGRPRKNNPLDGKTPHEVVINLKTQDFVKVQEQVQQHEEGKQAKKHKAALVQKDNK